MTSHTSHAIYNKQLSMSHTFVTQHPNSTTKHSENSMTSLPSVWKLHCMIPHCTILKRSNRPPRRTSNKFSRSLRYKWKGYIDEVRDPRNCPFKRFCVFHNDIKKRAIFKTTIVIYIFRINSDLLLAQRPILYIHSIISRFTSNRPKLDHSKRSNLIKISQY